MADHSKIAVVVDASGLNCPLPLLKLKQALRGAASGSCVQLIATDPGSVRDVHAYGDISGDKVVLFEEENGRYNYVIEKN